MVVKYEIFWAPIGVRSAYSRSAHMHICAVRMWGDGKKQNEDSICIVVIYSSYCKQLERYVAGGRSIFISRN